jgi:hypothetical protein
MAETFPQKSMEGGTWKMEGVIRERTMTSVFNRLIHMQLFFI